MTTVPIQRKSLNQEYHPQTKQEETASRIAQANSTTYKFCLEAYYLLFASIKFALGYLNILEMFGGRSFTAKAIPEQRGRVFLVTGGVRLRSHGGHHSHTNAVKATLA